jgi:hypothetical protein
LGEEIKKLKVMFNYNLNQNNANPNPNNFCGGYALAAILNNRNNMVLNTPAPMYNSIQNNQNGIGFHSQALINNTQINGTNICLPSSIAITAIQVNLIPRVVYGNVPFPPAIIQEELNRMQFHGIQTVINASGLNNLLLNIQERYFIVLVNNGAHWIAVERTLNNGFDIYDPGTGQITHNLQLVNYSGLVIAL